MTFRLWHGKPFLVVCEAENRAVIETRSKPEQIDKSTHVKKTLEGGLMSPVEKRGKYEFYGFQRNGGKQRSVTSI